MKRVAALLSLLLVTTTGCGLSGGDQANDGGVVSGGGQIVEYPKAADRGEPIALSGPTLDGGSVDIASYRGKVVVINIWWSGCPPCIDEAPKLQASAATGEAAFVGVNVEDSSASQGTAFERAHGITYPSIYAPDGSALLAFRGKVSAGVIPATLVLDAQGRVFAVIRGAIPGNSTLTDLIHDAAQAAA